MLDVLLALGVGLGLSAACGFRIFVPLLVVGLAARAEWLSLAEGFEWLSTNAALGAFAFAALLEIGGYYFPWVDNLLDTVSTPVAVVAGVIVSAAFIHDVHPLLRWSMAVVAGGGAAGTIKAGLAGLRLGSSTVTAGFGNPLIATAEWILAVFLALLALFVPILAGLLSLALVALLLRFALRLWRSRAAVAARTTK